MLDSNSISEKSLHRNWLHKNCPITFVSFSGAAAFITYCSMYAFRKPFAAATFDGLHFLGMDYKVLLIITQAIGYTASKFIGIKVVSELDPNKRIRILLLLMGIAGVSLLLFAIIPFPYNFLILIVNGLPLGLVWGIVFSFLEGRRFTEVLGAIMASSFIFASGVVKAAGRMVIDNYGVSDFWMPVLTAVLFIPILFVGIYMLQQIPPRDSEDEMYRTKRKPMDAAERKAFFSLFAPGIILSIITYVGLTIFRDLRDNFAVELWADLGFSHTPKLLALSEIPIALGVLTIIGLMILIKNNRIAFYTNQLIILTGGILLLTFTLLFMQQKVSALWWMIMIGFSMYLPYISFHVMFYERWIALFRVKSNIGYLMYISDAFGYLGSTLVLCFKGSGYNQLPWVMFFSYAGIVIGVLTVINGILSILYFRKKEKRFVSTALVG